MKCLQKASVFALSLQNSKVHFSMMCAWVGSSCNYISISRALPLRVRFDCMYDNFWLCIYWTQTTPIAVYGFPIYWTSKMIDLTQWRISIGCFYTSRGYHSNTACNIDAYVENAVKKLRMETSNTLDTAEETECCPFILPTFINDCRNECNNSVSPHLLLSSATTMMHITTSHHQRKQLSLGESCDNITAENLRQTPGKVTRSEVEETVLKAWHPLGTELL